MIDINKTKLTKINHQLDINNLVNEVINTSDIDSFKIKEKVFNFSFGLLDSGMQENSLKLTIDQLFENFNENGVNINDVFKNKNINNTVNNIIINYNINKYKTTDSKIEKDVSLSKIYNLLENMIIKIVKKENLGMFDEDLVSAGFIGIIKSLNNGFNPLLSDFSTFSYLNIRKEVQLEKEKLHPGFSFPMVYNYYYKVYSKTYKEFTNSDEIEYNKDILQKTYEELNKKNPSITLRLLDGIVNTKLTNTISLDSYYDGSDCNISESNMEELNYNTDNNYDYIKNKLDNEIFQEQIKKFLSNYTDFEKSILERRFGFDFGGDNTFTVYTMKVEKNGVISQKEMIAEKCNDAMSRVERLGYKILSKKSEIEKSRKTETVVGGNMEKLREYFEIKKLTQMSLTALKKNEDKIVKQLENYFKNIFLSKGIENPTFTIIV